MRTIQINDRIIGNGNEVYIIAEAGINHDGNVEQAKKMIQKAHDSGADAIKFQIFKTEEICSKNSDYYNLFKNLELDDADWNELKKFADKTKINFTASVFGKWSADFLEELGSSFYKIASGDLTYLPLLRYIGEKNKPIILSTGMSTIGEIEEALQEIYKTGNNKVSILHCVSNYPANYQDINLKVINTLKNLFQIPVGFSDHTVGTLVPSLAVVMGANIIEKHFTLDNNLNGPDHKLSLETHEFKEMVENIRIAEKALGQKIKVISESLEMISAARRSIFVDEVINEGDIISEDTLKVLRPEIGIKPKYLEFITGRISRKNLSKENPVKWDDVE